MESAESLTLQIVTPERRVVDRKVEFVSAPGSEGEFGVLAGHTEFFTTLKSGEITYRDERGIHILAVSWGYAEVKPESVTILAEHAVEAEEIQIEDALKEREKWIKRLEEISPEHEDYLKFKAMLDMVEARIAVAERTKEK